MCILALHHKVTDNHIRHPYSTNSLEESFPLFLADVALCFRSTWFHRHSFSIVMFVGLYVIRNLFAPGESWVAFLLDAIGFDSFLAVDRAIKAGLTTVEFCCWYSRNRFRWAWYSAISHIFFIQNTMLTYQKTANFVFVDITEFGGTACRQVVRMTGAHISLCQAMV